MLMEQIEAADKVVIGDAWFAMVDGAMYAGPMLTTSRMSLADATRLAANLEWAQPRVARARSLLQVLAQPMLATKASGGMLTEQQRKDAAALLRGTPEFIPSERC